MSTTRSWMKMGVLALVGFGGMELAASPFPCLFALVQTLDDGGDLVTAVAAAKADYDVTKTTPEIRLNKGTYKTASEMLLNFPIVIRGTTGNPADVIIEAQAVKNTAVYRVFTINDANAWVEAVTMTGGRLRDYGSSNYYNFGAGFRIAKPLSATQPDHSSQGAGGVVTNCIVTGCKTERTYTGGAGFYMNAPKGIVTHCVITNNTCTRQLNQKNGCDSGCRGGIVHVANGRFDQSLVADNFVEAPDLALSGTPVDISSLVGASGGTIANCTVCRNRIGLCGGPVMVSASGAASIVNTAVFANTIDSSTLRVAGWAEGDGRHAECWGGTAADFTYCGFATDLLPTDSCVTIRPSDVFDYWAGDPRLTHDSVLQGTGKDGADIGAFGYDPSLVKVTAAPLPATCWDNEPLTVSVPVVEGYGEHPTFYWSFADDGSVRPEDVTTEKVHSLLLLRGERTIHVSVSNLTVGVGTTLTVGKVSSVQKIFYVKAGNAGAQEPYATEATAAADIQTAIDFAPAGREVVICPGTYEITTCVFLKKKLTVRGQTGKPEDVIIRNVYSGTFSEPDNTGHGHCVLIDADPEALLTSVALEDANAGKTFTLYGALYIGLDVTGDGARGNWFKAGNGGCVSNVIIRNCQNGNKFGHGPALTAVGSNALVTHCTITNNSSSAVYVNGGTQLAFVELESGARLEHSLVAWNRVKKGSQSEPQGRLTAAVSLRGASKVRFCTIANNECSMVGGVNVCQSSTARVEYCVIGGNDAYESVGYYANPTTRHHDWGFFNLSRDNDPFGGTWTKLGQDKMAEWIAAEIAYVEANPNVVNAVFVGNITDHAVSGTSGTVAPLGDIYLGLGGRNVRLRAKSPARECVAVDAAGAMPALDLQGQPRLYGEKYDVGCYEGQLVPGLLMIVR